MWRRVIKCFRVILMLECCWCVYHLCSRLLQEKRTLANSTETQPLPLKSILVWNSVERYESAAEFGPGPDAFSRNKCPVAQCQIFFHRNALPFDQFDAVILNAFEIDSAERPEEVDGFERQPHQRYIFLSQESPRTIPINTAKFRNYFNWTMSYRMDSDIALLYGRIHPKSSAPKTSCEANRLIQETHQWNRTFANKAKSVVWMVSHCGTVGKRERYVEEMQRFMQIDVYGGCGELKCPRNEDHWISDPECYTLLANEYKFYLSFENSVCPDYVTEKFFEILRHDLVPVVYGGANYSSLAPPHSYIDALNFTPRQLARYLHQLSTNDTLYNEFFWWKEHYTVDAGMEQMVRQGYCELCRKLHQDSAISMYEQIDDYWKLDQCDMFQSWAKYGSAIANSSSDVETKLIGWPEESLKVIHLFK